MRRKNFWITLSLICSFTLNALPLAAQKNAAVKAPPVEFQVVRSFDPSEIFREFAKSGDDRVFSRQLKKLLGEANAADAENRLAAGTMSFFELMRADSARHLALVSLKAGEISGKRYEDLKTNPPAPPPATTRPRRGGPSAEAIEEWFFDPAPETSETKISAPIEVGSSVRNASDEPTVSTVETDTGIEISGSAGKTIDIDGATVTRTEKADTKTGTDGKSLSWAYGTEQKTEAVSKTGTQKLAQTVKMEWSAEFGICPDLQGRVPGRLKARIYNQTVIHTGQVIAAPTNDLELDLAVTGYVNDAAEMTHFDLAGTAVNKLTGYDRARERGLIEIEPELFDRARRIEYRIDASKPPRDEESPYGGKRAVSAELGTIRAVAGDVQTASEADLIGKFTGWGLQAGLMQLESLMKTSMSKWRGGECVDVELTAPKNALQPGETVDVTAASISKQDLSKFAARLEASGDASVAPPDQTGAPAAVFALTAPGSGDAGARIVVKSVSRRGIGHGSLGFGKSVLDDEPVCDGNWHGTIEIRKTREQIFKETTKPGDVGTNLHLSGWKESVNRFRYEGKVKITSPKVSTASVALLNASFSASAERYFLNHGFFTEPNECGAFIKKTIKTESGQENKESGSGEGATDVTIQVSGGEYRVSVSIPALDGAFQNRGWHRPSGYCREANNQPQNTNQAGSTRFDRVGVSFAGTIDPAQPDVLTGTQIVKSDDGTEETVIKWRIKRCAAAKPKPKMPAKSKR